MSNRKTALRTAAILILLVSMLAACSNNGKNGESSPAASPSQQTDAGASSPASPSAAAAQDPFGKYEPAIEVSTVRASYPESYFPKGDNLENNIWTRSFEEKLGIKLVNKWVVEGSQMNDKMNVTIASGDIPDLMSVSPDQYKQLVNAGLLAELSGVYEQYASPALRDTMEADPTVMDSVRIDGKMYALPFPEDPINHANIMWLRHDWLEKLGLPEPKTLDDLLAVMDAFREKDPDGNGKKDTFGLGIIHNDLKGFVNSMHAYSGIWIKGADGQLAYSSVQPEMKAALQKLQELYKKGIIDKEYSSKGDKVYEDIVGGKIGLIYAGPATPNYPLQQSFENDGADWRPYPLTSMDGQPSKSQRFSGSYPVYYVVSKEAKHPEAAVKIANLFLENVYGKDAKGEYLYGANGEPSYAYPPISIWPKNKNIGIHRDIVEAEKSGSTSHFKFVTEGTLNYDQSVQYRKEGKKEFWKIDRTFGPEGGYKVVDEMLKNDLYQPNQFYGVNTDTMDTNKSVLDTLEFETFTKIIMGASIDEFDKFTAEWNKLGGEQITKEVNEWFASKS